jgi:hypothetical protein
MTYISSQFTEMLTFRRKINYNLTPNTASQKQQLELLHLVILRRNEVYISGQRS